MRDLDATQQTSPVPVSRTSVETTHPPNERGSIFKQLDKLVCDANSVEKKYLGNLYLERFSKETSR
jgi:hypothetical protein